jgi:hypothetical protein
LRTLHAAEGRILIGFLRQFSFGVGGRNAVNFAATYKREAENRKIQLFSRSICRIDLTFVACASATI